MASSEGKKFLETVKCYLESSCEEALIFIKINKWPIYKRSVYTRYHYNSVLWHYEHRRLASSSAVCPQLSHCHSDTDRGTWSTACNTFVTRIWIRFSLSTAVLIFRNCLCLILPFMMLVQNYKATERPNKERLHIKQGLGKNSPWKMNETPLRLKIIQLDATQKFVFKKERWLFWWQTSLDQRANGLICHQIYVCVFVSIQ